MKKRRRKTLIFLFVAFVLISLSAFHLNNVLFRCLLALAIALLVSTAYYFIQRNRFAHSLTKNVFETYKHRFGKSLHIEFTADQLLTVGADKETKINLTQLEEINETGSYFLLKFKSGERLIVPKAQVSANDFSLLVQQIVEKYAIPFTQELNWKFR